MLKKSKVSIIIPTWNGKKWLAGCFPSLKKQTYKNFEVIVVDNDSSDNTSSWLVKHHPWVRVVKSKRNLGYGKANNLGVKRARGEIIFLLNNDTKLKQNTLKKLIEFKKKSNFNIVGPRLLDFKGNDIYEGKKLSIDPLSVHGWGKHTFYVDGCALMIDKRDYLKLGGFDAKYFMYNEDIDLSWRAWLLGMKIGVAPDSSLIHYGGGSSTKTMYSKKEKYVVPIIRRYEVEKNNLRNILKNYSFPSLLWVTPLYVVQQTAEAVFYLLTGNFKMISALTSAVYWNTKNISSTMKARRVIQRHRKVPDSFILSLMTPPLNKVNTFIHIGLPKYV